VSIDRNDRSFDHIFDEIQVHSIPVKYIDRLRVILKDGTEIDTADPEHQKRVISAVDVADIKDLQISLDYDAIKKDVTNEINDVLGNIFKDDDEGKT
jgi:hypothetical protein|tara:strand:- start:1485 stop:1775 length:291 start_codon:yes stop_codon:yes gene_type:complete